MGLTTIICPLCDNALKEREGLVIRPTYNGFFNVRHVDYSQPVTVARTLCLGEFKRLRID